MTEGNINTCNVDCKVNDTFEIALKLNAGATFHHSARRPETYVRVVYRRLALSDISPFHLEKLC